jgi:hypothetical protein
MSRNHPSSIAASPSCAVHAAIAYCPAAYVQASVRPRLGDAVRGCHALARREARA